MKIRKRRTRQLRDVEPATWGLAYLDGARADALKILNKDQYAHVVQQFDALAREENPRLSRTQDVRPIEAFYELRDKGGVLGKINLRVYFAVMDDPRLILVLGCYKKEDEGQVATHIKVKMRNRLRIAIERLAPGRGV